MANGITRVITGTRRRRGGAALLVVLTAAISTAQPHAAAADDVVIPPAVPGDLQPPAGNEAYLMLHAEGTQNYICLPSGNEMRWTFLGPQATLFDADGNQVMTHYLSLNPLEIETRRATWQHSRDSSTIWAGAVAESLDSAYVEPGAIAWLLLRVYGAEQGPSGGDKIVRTTYIQRVNTSGGNPSAAACSMPSDFGKRQFVPYTTDYVFYRLMK